jgi:hypothetical protein
MGLVDSLGALGARQFRLLMAGQTSSNLGSSRRVDLPGEPAMARP